MRVVCLTDEQTDYWHSSPCSSVSNGHKTLQVTGTVNFAYSCYFSLLMCFIRVLWDSICIIPTIFSLKITSGGPVVVFNIDFRKQGVPGLTNVTKLAKTILNGTFCVSRNSNFNIGNIVAIWCYQVASPNPLYK